MGLEVVISSNPIRDRDSQLAREFEQAVFEALSGHDALAGSGAVQVRFHVWDADDGARYVCKVECTGPARLEAPEPPWRWWSGLVASAQDLRQALREAVRARLGRRRAKGNPLEAPPPAVERWGWAGELQPR